MHKEYLPATDSPRSELVLLHGWGCSRDIWRPLLSCVRPWANVTLLDLPGLAPGLSHEPVNLDLILEGIFASSPERAVFMGWSLGGQLALELASTGPDRVEAVVTLCSTPCFLEREGWPGMPSNTLVQFSDAFTEDPAAGLRRFDSLQVTGAASPRPLLRKLQACRSGDPGGELEAGLAWLASLDQRHRCRELTQPQLHLLGECDGLLAASLPRSMTALLKDVPNSEVAMLAAASHLAPLEQGEAIAHKVLEFLRAAQLLSSVQADVEPMAKSDVAHSFSRAAPQYDSVASLQRDVGTALMARLDKFPVEPDNVLDLGSGTGYFCPQLVGRYPGAGYIGLDLAEGMVRFSQTQYPETGSWLVADAETLPLAGESIDLIFSSLALQWCHRPVLLFAELARVLRPGGRCLFATLGPQTLKELRSSWAAVDQHQHVNSFLPAEVLMEAVGNDGEMTLTLQEQLYRMEYGKVSELLHELKTLGAHNVNRDRPSGLMGRRVLQGMMNAYEDWREAGVLPATYQVYFGVLEKS
ncbi:MAG: malonyl-ACP O-methyltransferase BioC [Halioglobus sp.]